MRNSTLHSNKPPTTSRDLVGNCINLSAATVRAQTCSTPNWTVFATGLTNPRNIRIGPKGDIYVAEAGVGGELSTRSAFPIWLG